MQTFISGKKIRAARKAKGLTHEDILEKTGVSISTLSNIERELKEPRLDTLRRIADALEVDIYEFINLPVKTIEMDNKKVKTSGRLTADEAKKLTTAKLDVDIIARKELNRIYQEISLAINDKLYKLNISVTPEYKDYVLIKLKEDGFNYSIDGSLIIVYWR